jgi:hypothetical protein
MMDKDLVVVEPVIIREEKPLEVLSKLDDCLLNNAVET